MENRPAEADQVVDLQGSTKQAYTVFTEAPRGAVYKPLHVERQVRIFPIQEHELTTLTMFSGIVTICSSIASATIVYVLSILWDMVISEKSEVQKAGAMFTGVCGVVIAVCIGIGCWAHLTKRSHLQKILSESRAGER